MKVSKINKQIYLELYNSGKTDLEISKTMKTPYRTISNFRKNILKLPLVKDNISITKEQEEILIGTLLGDSNISLVHKKCKYPNLTFSHSIKQEKYFYEKYKNLDCLMSSFIKREYHKTRIIKGKIANIKPVLYGIGRNLKVLQEYRNIFYPKGVKIIPIDFLKNRFTKRSLAYLFMDDGNRNKNTINLNLHCFTLENLKDFVLFMKEEFNLEFSIKKDKTLYLKTKSYSIFKEMVLPYMTFDTLYKLP